MRDVMVLPTVPNVGTTIVRALLNGHARPHPTSGLPNRSALVMAYRADAERTARYMRMTGFAVRDVVPATWLHVLTFPLQASIMAQRDFPFPLAGIVHVSNDMTLHRLVHVSDSLRLHVEAKNLQPHRRGVTFEMVGRIHVGEDLVWEGTSVYLTSRATIPGEPVAPPRLEVPNVEPSQQWRLPADLGRRYARVSGDSNPIHLHPLTAKLFGFPRPIIHGMWTHARALAAFGGALPERYRVRIQFTKPIMLPAKVRFAADADRRFVVAGSDGKPRLVGLLEPRDGQTD